MCFDDDAVPPIEVKNGTGARGQDLDLKAADGTRVMAFMAEPGKAPESQVLILPDIRGLHTFYKELCLRFAESGQRALAIDYFGRTAETDDRTDGFEYMPHVVAMTPESFELDLNTAASRLREHGDLPTYSVGFCYGGSLSFWSGTRDIGLAGVVGFYAGFGARGARTSPLEYAADIRCKLLGLFGGADESIPREVIDEFEDKLSAAGVDHEIVVYPGAPHSFFDRRAEQFAAASADAWRRVQAFTGNAQRSPGPAAT
jgi:carboxymethylenebutenolidase